MPDTLTPNYALTLIEEFGSIDTWGGKINANMSLLDTELKQAEDAAVDGPASSVAGNVASFADATGKLIADSGKLAANVVTGPAVAVSGNLAVFSGTTGKIVADGGTVPTGNVTGPASAVANRIAIFSGTTGKVIADGGALLTDKANTTHTHAIADVTNLQTSLDAKSDKGVVDGLNSQTGTSYTLLLADAGKIVEMNNAAGNTLTIPTNAVAAFALNTRIDITQMGAGQTTVGGAGVTIRSEDAKLKLTGQYAGATLYKRGTNEWVLIGNIAA